MKKQITYQSRPTRIDEEVYLKVKKYCDENSLKISKWISRILMEKLNDLQKAMPKS